MAALSLLEEICGADTSTMVSERAELFCFWRAENMFILYLLRSEPK